MLHAARVSLQLYAFSKFAMGDEHALDNGTVFNVKLYLKITERTDTKTQPPCKPSRFSFCVWFQVLTVASMKITVFWDVVPCSVVDVYWRITGQWVLIALMLDAASTSETSVNFYQTTRRNIPEDSHLPRYVSVATKVSNFWRGPKNVRITRTSQEIPLNSTRLTKWNLHGRVRHGTPYTTIVIVVYALRLN
jgi:hypothetical protein